LQKLIESATIKHKYYYKKRIHMPPQNPIAPSGQPNPQPPQPVVVSPVQQQPVVPSPAQQAAVTPVPVAPQQQLPYSGQTPYPSQPMQLNPAYGHDKLATASLILGIISLPTAILNILTLPIPIAAIVIGVISLKSKKSFAIAGIVLGCVGLILTGAVLVVGSKMQHRKLTSDSSIDKKINVTANDASAITTSCYTFSKPAELNEKGQQGNTDCNSLYLNSTSTEDLLVKSLGTIPSMTDAQRDADLQIIAKRFVGTLGELHATNSTFTSIGGIRAYQVTGTEAQNGYKYFGAMVVIVPKDYTAAGGNKWQSFMIVYDSAANQNLLDKIAQSWQWK
jgi:hypothetical protein